MIPTMRGLALACHPGPSLAVTAFAGALGVSAGLSAPRTLLLVCAVLSGQLSIGWLNDYRDRDLDSVARRPDKPLTSGAIGAGAVRTAMAVEQLAPKRAFSPSIRAAGTSRR